MNARSAVPGLALGLLGLGAVVWMVDEQGIDEVARALRVLGWGLVPVLLWRAAPILCDAIGWHVLFAPGRRPPFGVTGLIRWVSESVNALLPVAQVGGEIVRARLISRRSLVPSPEVSGGEAAGTVIVDLTTGLIATAAFALLGLILLLDDESGWAAGEVAMWAIGGLIVMIAGFVLFQRGRGLAKIAEFVGSRLASGAGSGLQIETRALEATFERLWADPATLARSTAWRLASFLASAAEVWLILRLMGTSISIEDAVTLEALSTAARSAAFAVPGGLGVQEASLLALGAALGVPAPATLALALVKRAREIAVGLPALAWWWWIGTRGATLRG